MPFRPTRSLRSSSDPKLSTFLSTLTSLTSPSPSPSPTPTPGSVPAAPTPAAYNALMAAFSRAGRPDEVVRLFCSLPFPTTTPLFTTLISSLAASGHPLAARAAFSSLLSSGLPPSPSSFTALLKSHHSSLDFVYHIFLDMAAAGCSPDAVAYNCLISILCDSQRIEEAWGVLDLMLENGLRPSVRSYTAIVRGYCELGRIQEAERLVNAMSDVGCPPDVVSYSVLIEGFCRAGEFGKVERILEESRVKGWRPNAVTYNIYMSGLCRMGFLDEAFRQIDAMRERGLCPTVETVNILFDCLCRDSKVSEAACLLERSQQLGWVPDMFFYNTLMSRLCDIGEFARVLKLLVNLVKKGIGPDTFSFTIAVRSLCRAGKLRLAKCIIDGRGIDYDVVAFNTLIHGFCMAGDLQGVQLTYMDMVNRNIFPNNFTYGMMIDSLCKEGKFFEAINCLLESLKDGFVPDLLARLNNWLVKRKKLREVLNLLDEMSHRGFVLDACVFNSLVRVFCRQGYCQSEDFYKVCLILDTMLGVR